MEIKLEQYPSQIAEKSREVIGLDEKVSLCQLALNRIELDVDRQILNDLSLKNDLGRKIRRQELIDESQKYALASASLAAAKREKKLAEIDLQELQDSFSVAKLSKREVASRLEIALKSIL